MKPPASYSSTSRPDTPAWRYAKAILFAAVIAGVCALAVKLTTKKVRDLTPAEMRDKMNADALNVDTAITQINRMDLDDRRELMQSPEAQRYFQKLQPQDRKRFVIETMDKGIRMQIERFHKMNADERAEFISTMRQQQLDAREQFLKLPKEEQDKRREMLNSSNMQEIVEKAVKAYLSVSTSQERAELAPLYEGALDNARFIKGQ